MPPLLSSRPTALSRDTSAADKKQAAAQAQESRVMKTHAADIAKWSDIREKKDNAGTSSSSAAAVGEAQGGGGSV